jgi:CHAD domain-containing protein
LAIDKLFRKKDAFAFAADQTIRQYLAELDDRVHQAQKRPSAETLRRLRVLARRLRLSLNVFRKVLPPYARKVGRELYWLQHATDELRDLQVQRGVLAKYAQLLSGSAQKVLRRQSLKLDRKIRFAERKVKRALTSRRSAKLLEHLNDLLTQQPLPPGKSVRTAGRKAILKALDHFRKRARRSKTDRDFHRLRIALRKLRYTLAFFESIESKKKNKLMRRIKNLQTVLGDYHDLVVTGRILQATDLSGLSKPVMQKMENQLQSDLEKQRELFRGEWKRFVQKQRLIKELI